MRWTAVELVGYVLVGLYILAWVSRHIHNAAWRRQREAQWRRQARIRQAWAEHDRQAQYQIPHTIVAIEQYLSAHQ